MHFLAILLRLRAKEPDRFLPPRGCPQASVPLLQATCDKDASPCEEQTTAALLQSDQRRVLVRLTYFGKARDPLSAVLQALAAGSVLQGTRGGYEVESVDLTDPTWTGVRTWPDLLSEYWGGRMRLTFATPVITAPQERRQAGNALPFPNPQALFSRALRHWQALGGPPLPYDEEQALEATRCVVTEYCLETTECVLEGHSHLGYLGWIEYTCRTPEVIAVASLNALARLAFFTGSGYLTERGMGVTAVTITN